MKTLRIGTRKSPLALAQSTWVADQLRRAFSDLQIEILHITTAGDRLTQGRGRAKAGGLKALFTKEIEEALLDERIDIAVHSMKDMAADLPKGLIIGAVPPREDPRDVWISKTKTPLLQMSAGSVIGTGAVRRAAQLQRLYPKAKILPIRGNVDTRLRKLESGELDGIVLALAGLRRLGRESAVTDIFPIKVLLPAVGQGCLGIQVRQNDIQVNPYLKVLDHPESHAAATAERAFLQTLGGNCQTPIAGHARMISKQLQLSGLIISPDGAREVRGTVSGPMKEAAQLGQTLAHDLLVNGGDKIL